MPRWPNRLWGASVPPTSHIPADTVVSIVVETVNSCQGKLYSQGYFKPRTGFFCFSSSMTLANVRYCACAANAVFGDSGASITATGVVSPVGSWIWTQWLRFNRQLWWRNPGQGISLVCTLCPDQTVYRIGRHIFRTIACESFIPFQFIDLTLLHLSDIIHFTGTTFISDAFLQVIVVVVIAEMPVIFFWWVKYVYGDVIISTHKGLFCNTALHGILEGWNTIIVVCTYHSCMQNRHFICHTEEWQPQ